MDENAAEHAAVKAKADSTIAAKPLQDASNKISSKLMPSSAELEKRYIDGKRLEIHQMRLRNERSCKKAIQGHESSLSRSICSDDGRSRRREKPKELTVPRGPTLHTSWRPRSTERGEKTTAAPGWSHSLRQADSVGTPRARSQSRGPRLEAPRFEVSSSPRARMGHHLDMTPESVRSGRSLARSVRSLRSTRSGSNLSVDSQLSRSSSQCSRLSSLDLEEMAAEEGRRRLAAQLRRNAKSYKQAINNPDMRRGHHSLKLTVPEEFHLSVSNRADQRGHLSREESRNSWCESLRPETEASKWCRESKELTVPLGPELNTSRRSCSRDRESSRQRSISCQRMPQREQEAIARHLNRSTKALKAPVDVKVQLTEEDQRWIQDAGNAKARAARARTAMQKRSEEAYNEQKEKLFVFAAGFGKDEKQAE